MSYTVINAFYFRHASRCRFWPLVDIQKIAAGRPFFGVGADIA